MPEANLMTLTEKQLKDAKKYKLGYDWIPGRFGPPPGIPRQQKDELGKKFIIFFAILKIVFILLLIK